jgi:hypothetical protein
MLDKSTAAAEFRILAVISRLLTFKHLPEVAAFLGDLIFDPEL